MELKVDAANNKFANAAILVKDNLDMLLYEDNTDEQPTEARRLSLDLNHM